MSDFSQPAPAVMHASLLENSAVQEAVCGLPTKSMNKMNVVVMPISGPYKRPCDGERKPRYFNILEEIIISCDEHSVLELVVWGPIGPRH